MGMIINIDKALELRTDFNVLKEPLNAMLKDRAEQWEEKNPIDLLFVRGSLSSFQETYTSSIGFDHALTETGDYAVAPIFNTEEGFSATYTTRTFQGGFIVTQQALEDKAYNNIKDTANKFMTRWGGDIVEYSMLAISAGFGKEVVYDSTKGKSRLKLMSADTTDGDINTPTKNPLFSNKHTIVKRDGMKAQDITDNLQSNIFRAAKDTTNTDLTPAIVIGSNDPGQIAKLADIINLVVTEMENYKDDNNKYAGVMGEKVIVAPNDPHLKAALNAAVTMSMFNDTPNPGYQRARVETTSYLNNIPQCKGGLGFFIVDKAYNEANHGPEFTERVAMTLNVSESKNPYGVSYDARQRFDINVASWRGIAYVFLGTATSDSEWTAKGNFTPLVPVATLVQPVSVVGSVTTAPGK